MQAHLFISGIVQGVGYRQFVKSQAKKLGLKGWVRNLSDGRVEALIQGEKGKLEELIEKCWEGPFLAEVKDMHITWEETTKEFSDFTIEKG